VEVNQAPILSEPTAAAASTCEELSGSLGEVDDPELGEGWAGTTHTGDMRIRLEAHDLPGRSCGPSPERPGGHHGIEVGVQRKNKPDDLMGQVSADVESAIWELEATPVASEAADYRGPYISGPPGGRFVYLSWGVVEKPGSFEMFRRAKIMLDGIPADVMAAAQASGVLVGRFGLTDPKGNPTCAAVRPPLIEWTSASE
jgi:hypothetical protein